VVEALMSLPQHALSDPAFPAAFLVPDDMDSSLLESFEYGGVAINDGTQGRMVQFWRAWIDVTGTTIQCSPISGSPITTLVTGATNLTSVSIAFDSNMAPALAYIENGVLKFRWFNTTIQAFQTDIYTGATSGKVSADDKRRSQDGASDVILGYTRGGKLFTREQRDRYQVEYEMGPCGSLKLRRMGMHNRLRFQFELYPS
jgi:hypothetical protein